MAIVKSDGTKTYTDMCLSMSTQYNSSMDVTSYYVKVYNEGTDTFESIYVDCDFPSDEPRTTYTIDATPDVIAKWEARRAAQVKHEHDMQELAAIMTPEVGKQLEVIKGRKVPKGTMGVCFWIGNSAYGERVGIKDANNTVHWTAISNVQVI
jgi:hypothetical protein